MIIQDQPEMPSKKEITPPKTNMTMEKTTIWRCKDLFPIKQMLFSSLWC